MSNLPVAPARGNPPGRRSRRGRLRRRAAARRGRSPGRRRHPSGKRTGPRGHPPGRRRRVERRRPDCRRAARRRHLQLREPAVRQVGRTVAADGRSLPRLRRAHGSGARHGLQPLRLRPRRRAHDGGSAAGCHRNQGEGADPDVAGRQGRERCRPHPRHRGARLGLHLPRGGQSQFGDRVHAADPRGQVRAASR